MEISSVTQDQMIQTIINAARNRFETTGDHGGTLETLSNDLKFYGIRTKYAAKSAKEIDRLLLTFNGRQTPGMKGTVYSFPSMIPLAICPASLWINPRAKDVYSLMSQKNKPKIYAVYDGTMITLYYWDGKWRMSTANGFEVNNYKWLSERTYEEAFKEATAIYPEFSLEKLDKNMCYSISFRHPDFQPLLTDPSGAMLIQAANPRTGDIDQTVDIGLPIQKLLSMTAKQIFEESNDALARFIGSKSIPIYGFVIRPVNGEQGVLVESTLLRRIRQMMYMFPKEKSGKIRSSIVPGQSRTNFCIIRAYLDHRNKELFIKLFPQFTANYKRYDEFFVNLTNRFISALRNKNIRANILERVPAAGLVEIDSCIAQIIDQVEHIDPFEPVSEQIIADLVIDVRYVFMYHTALHPMQ